MSPYDETERRYLFSLSLRAVRLVPERRCGCALEWEAINSFASKIGCDGETLCGWVRRAERDAGVRLGPTSAVLSRIKGLEREVRVLRQANEILGKASACFAMAELDRPLKR